MSVWKSFCLGDVVTFQRGYDLPKRKMIDGVYPVIGSNGIIGWHNKFTTENPSITVGRSGNVGQPFIYYGKSWSHNTTLFIKEFKNVHPQFIYYLLKTLNLNHYAGGTAVPTLNRNHIKNLPINLPPLDTQKKIAAVLSALDDKIELNNAINKNLEEQAQAIFKSWFIDFEPFGGTMPDDWRIEEFQSLLTERREKSNNPKLKLFSVTDSGILPREEKFKKKLSKPTTINKVIYQGDLVFGMSRKILNWGVMRECIGAVSSAYNIFSVSEKVNSKYLESFIKQNIIYFHDLIRPASREGQGLDKGILMRKKIYLPDDETLKRYYEVEDSLTTTVNVIRQENQKLGELRDVLLPRLMSGEIDVSAVEI